VALPYRRRWKKKDIRLGEKCLREEEGWRGKATTAGRN